MKYFFDTEFLEGSQKILFGLADSRPTIDLISIGIVADDGREYYAISKDFNLKEAWNRHDLKVNKNYPAGPKNIKVYWIRENVLKPIWKELCLRYLEGTDPHSDSHIYSRASVQAFSYSSLKYLIDIFGKSNKKIAEEIKKFVYTTSEINDPNLISNWEDVKHSFPINFYAYYSAYDWVVFCWIFGKMIDLPKGFPMYCRDLKQMLDEKVSSFDNNDFFEHFHKEEPISLEQKLVVIKKRKDYPTQDKEHNALEDARWNFKLYQFIKSL